MAKAQEAVIELEELGFRCVWVPEAVGREPFASCGLLLSATKKLTMATGIASMHARSATTMAAGWKTLTEKFGDRFLLGIGASHQHLAEKVHQSTYEKPYSAMVEYLDVMDNAVFFAATNNATTSSFGRARAKDVETFSPTWFGCASVLRAG